MDMTSIGRNIRHFRNLKNISQEGPAEKTDLSTNYISMIECGEKIPSLTSLIRIANALEITSDMILCDLVTKSYCVKNSVIMDRISELSKKEQQISEFLGVSVKYLLNGIDNDKRYNNNNLSNSKNVAFEDNAQVNKNNEIDNLSHEMINEFEKLSFIDKAKVISLIAELREKYINN